MMKKEYRDAVTEMATGILLTGTVAAVAGDAPAWVYLVSLFAGLGIGSAIAAWIDACRPAKRAAP